MYSASEKNKRNNDEDILPTFKFNNLADSIFLERIFRSLQLKQRTHFSIHQSADQNHVQISYQYRYVLNNDNSRYFHSFYRIIISKSTLTRNRSVICMQIGSDASS